MSILVDTLKKALSRERIQCSLSRVANDSQISLGSLSRFASGKRGLSVVAIERLCDRLNVRFVLLIGKRPFRGPMLRVIRKGLLESRSSIRAIAFHTGIDPGNLCRFASESRTGLDIRNIDSLCQYLKIGVESSGQLQIEVLREHKVGDVTPVRKANVSCYCMNPYIFMHTMSNADGVASFDDIPIGATVEITINEMKHEEVQMMENVQVHSVVV